MSDTGVFSSKTTRRMSGVALWVVDLEASAGFYRDVIGAPIVYSDPHEPKNVPHYETMWNGDGRLIDQLNWSREGPADPSLWFNLYPAEGPATSRVELTFPVPSVDEVHERAVAAGVQVLLPPQAGTWGGREAVYEDPDGNVVVVSDA